MRIRILKSVKDGSGWIQPGTIRDFVDSEARRLIRLRAAELLSDTPLPSDVTEPDVPDESDESGIEEYTDEELDALAEALCEIDGVDNDIAYRLIEAGYVDTASVADANPADLIKVKGIGNKSVVKIQESAEDLADSEDDDDDDDVE